MVSTQEVSCAILDILLRLRMANAKIGNVIDRWATTSRMWQDIWPPGAGPMYLRERLDRNQKPRVRLYECVEDFREWACTRLRIAYDFSRATYACFRDCTHGVLGLDVAIKKVLIFHGYESKHPPDVQNRNKSNPALGMGKRGKSEIYYRILIYPTRLACESILGETYTPRNPRVMAAAGSYGRISTPPRRLVIARG